MKLFILVLTAASAMLSFTAFADLAEDRARADSLLEAGDEKGAFKAYRDLARDGDHDAQYLVSVMYAQGRGTKADLIDAYGWSVVAAEAGLDKLDVHRDSLYASIDAKEQKKADRKARSLVNKYGQEALQEKADRLATRGAGRRMGSCTGSRLSCRSGQGVAIAPVGGAGAPPTAPGGNN